MTSGAPIYLVSACASGEEFVAAFRRYADKNGLFIPIAAPIPAGRRGRFAVTLKDGGVMVEGEADIVSSATTPSVLHGRVGMTLRFIEPDIKSKTVLVELEQARLAMKPQPPSVPPRPAKIPDGPRPKVPTIAGRIDANNALAECVAIGDIEALEATVPQVQKAGPRFVVPTIPPVAGQRPKSPSTPPLAYPAIEKKPSLHAAAARPQTPSSPPPLSAAPAIPPKPSQSGPTFVAAPITPGGITMVDAPIVPAITPHSMPIVDAPAELAMPRTSTALGVMPADRSAAGHREPARTSPGMMPFEREKPATAPKITPMSVTTIDAPIITPTSMGAVPAPAEDLEPVEQRDDAIDRVRDTVAMPAMSRTMSDELTVYPQVRDAGLFQVQVPPGSESDTFPAVVITKPDGVPEAVPTSSSEGISKPNGSNSTRMALPPPRRTSGNTQPPPRNPTPAQPMPVIKGRPPTPAQPMPVVKQAGASAPIAMPRGSPTRIGLPIVELKTPAQPSGEIPMPPVVAEAKPAQAEVHDEPTEITGVPVIADEIADSAAEIIPEPPPKRANRPSIPGSQRKTVMGVAVVPDGVTVLPATPSTPIAKPTEEAIEAASEPQEAKVEVDLGRTLDDPPKPTVRPPVIEEPSGDWTMVPGAMGPTILPRTSESTVEEDKPDSAKLPTGDWTIARIEDSPDGWSEPSKVDLAPIQKNIRANTGPTVATVAGEKPLEITMTAKAFEFEEETRSGLKVEVDSSLGVERPTSSVDVSLASTQVAVPPVQDTPVPMPPPMMGAPMSSTMTPMVRSPSHGSGQFPDYPTVSRSSGPADLFSNAAAGESTERDRKRLILIIVGVAGVVFSFGAVLFVMFGLSGETKKKEDVGGSAGVVKPVDPPLTPDAVGMAVNPVVDDAGAGEPLEQTPDAAEAAVEPPAKPPRDCIVDVSSTPNGAEIVKDKQVVGTTPTKLTLPCGVEAKLVLRKGKLGSVPRTVKPTEAGTKIRVAFTKQMLSVKVTSSPPGATITMGGKSLGVTPAMVKLPAQEAATLSIAKPGFGAETQKITPKQNNQAVHVTLKKKAR
ncbi:MAG: PEGA domain-containing protein [Myxococcota bacterium]|nr:PEGA domain-containing protein [Myxococcota bacterium]